MIGCIHAYYNLGSLRKIQTFNRVFKSPNGARCHQRPTSAYHVTAFCLVNRREVSAILPKERTKAWTQEEEISLKQIRNTYIITLANQGGYHRGKR